MRAGAGEAARGMSLPRVAGLEAGDTPRFPVLPNTARLWSAAFFVASFIAREVTAGGGTPSRETGAWLLYDGGASRAPGRADRGSTPGAGVAMPW